MSPLSVALVIGVIPLAWSAVVWAARRRMTPNDAGEKGALVLMLAPVILGFAILIGGPLFPMTVPIALPEIAETFFVIEAQSHAPIPEAAQSGASFDLVWKIGFALYLSVFTFKSCFLMSRQIELWRVATTSERHEGVRVSLKAVPPLALFWAIVIPETLMSRLSPAQIRLVVAHERAHQRRADTVYFPLLSWLEVVFWFNLALLRQTQRCREAAELACDAMVLKERPEMRRAYAESLLVALKHTAGDVRQHAPAVFSTANSGEIRMRITEIMRPRTAARKSSPLLVLVAALLVPVAGLQMIWTQGASALSSPTPAPSDDRLFTAVPVQGQIVSGFGMRDNPVTGEHSMHEAVDIASPIGTPVYSPAPGRVIRADMKEPWFGYVLEISHPDGYVTRYMHLDHIDVRVGDTVAAGQAVAASGNTGRSTGPHTHIALFKDGKATDPVTMIPMPSS